MTSFLKKKLNYFYLEIIKTLYDYELFEIVWSIWQSGPLAIVFLSLKEMLISNFARGSVWVLPDARQTHACHAIADNTNGAKKR